MDANVAPQGAVSNGKPTALPVMPDNIPDELKRIPRWVCWRYRLKRGVKMPKTRKDWTKVPYRCDGRLADATNPATWCSFDDALAAYQGGRHGFDGIGIVLWEKDTDANGLVLAGVDFDEVMKDESTKSIATARIKRLGSYVEVSPSNMGLRVFLLARPLPSGIVADSVELYTSGRYLTVTGQNNGRARPVRGCADAFAALAAEVKGVPLAPRSPTLTAALGAPAAVFQGMKSADDLGAGLGAGWFAGLPPERMNDALRHAFDRIDNSGAKDGYDLWTRMIWAARDAEQQGATEAREIALEWSRRGGKWGGEEAFDRIWDGADRAAGPRVTVGTLIKAAQDGGTDFAEFRREVGRASWECLPPPAPVSDMPNIMDPSVALEHMNSRYFHADDWGGSATYGQRMPNGSVRRVDPEGIARSLANRRVQVPKGDKGEVQHVPVFKWWEGHPGRREYDRVAYDPERREAGNVLNLWRGFAVAPQRGDWRLMKRHLWEVICDRDKAAFKYLLRWMAHAVQRPGTAPETMVVLRSDAEGTGKSMVGGWLNAVFGPHGMELDDPEQLVGRFNDHLEHKSFILVNEPAFPGEHALARKLKARITAAKWTIEVKGGRVYEVPNIAHIMLTSNEDWVVPAGAQARRFLVLEVSDRRAGDRGYFDRLHQQAKDEGGLAAMLHELLKMDLSRFNPRRVPVTAGLRAQQLHSLAPEEQWMLNAVDTGELIRGVYSLQHGGSFAPQNGGFSQTVQAKDLHSAYLEYCKQQGHRRPQTSIALGMWLRKVGLKNRKVPPANVSGWDVPDAATLEAMVRKAAGLR